MRRPNAGQSLESKEQEPGLMDKWREHYRNRDFSTQPYHLHRAGMFSYFYCVLVVPFFAVTIILPKLEVSTTEWLLMSALVLFLTVESLLHYNACIKAHIEKDQVFLFAANKPNPLVRKLNGDCEFDSTWRHCVHCQAESPPRSHHCKICQACVLRRDHHCYFMCCCIGHYSQKHFIVLCLYNIVGLSYGIALCAMHLMNAGASAWDLLLPVTVYHWANGPVTCFGLLLLLSAYLQLACLSMAVIYLFLETVLVVRGQTFHEMGHSVRRYQLGIYENLKTALGPWHWWPLLLLLPVDSPQAADGSNWQVSKHR